VLAFGFGEYPERVLETLASGLAKSCSLRELYREVSLVERWFPSECPASLFTTDPDLPAWF
jgi:hypothetical protein